VATLTIADPTQACLVADFYHLNPVNFTKLAAANWNGVKCPAVIMKCSQGATYADPLYAQRVGQARAVGLLVAPYAFNTGEDVAAQLSEFLTHAHLDDQMGGWLDFEDNRASPMTLDQALEFMDRYDQATGRSCGMYAGNRIKETVSRATQAQRDFLAAHAFWGCEYGPEFVMKDYNGHPLPWDTPFLWQFTGDGAGPLPHTLDGLEQGADLSIFRGSPDVLRNAWPLPAMPQQVTS
jgi:GH25 family lysozyme M1 (1,4-beta-N-acetylmuramidase)